MISKLEVRERAARIMVKVFFTAGILCVLAETFQVRNLLLWCKPILMPSLALLYWLTSVKKNYWFIVSLLLILGSNIFLLSVDNGYILQSNVFIIAHRIISILLVLALIGKISPLPFFIATVPFLFLFSSLINLTIPTDSPVLFPIILNTLLLSCIAGIALSAYVMNDNKANSWLAISTLLFIVLTFLFMIQKFYLANQVFQPISALVFLFGHYAFYRFMVQAEKNSMVLNHDRATI